jgi:c-di-AMP phosphodiesterase-like protein
MIVRPVNENKFRISLRSMKGGPNVRIIAENMLGGGGHDHAAGGFFETTTGSSVENICSRIIDIFSDPNFEIEIL